jgi:AmmeMemoRadiSam system protein B
MHGQMKLRGLADTVGFAHLKSQMDVVMQRIELSQGKRIAEIHAAKNIREKDAWRMVIAPHDDYAYAGNLYPLILKNVKTKTVILFGVAHDAAKLKLEDKLIFDSFSHWRGPYGNIRVSRLREAILKNLPKGMGEVNDSMQTMEHSVEAELPFLQYYDKEVEIVSILVPFMSYERMRVLGKGLAEAIAGMMTENKLDWGRDVAFVVSTDAVHYGDQGWQGRNFAFFGADTAGYAKAVDHEHKIMDECFEDSVTEEKIKRFTEYTVKKENHKEYQWTWCGRYSVPMGLLTGLYVQELLKSKPLQGIVLDHATSLDHTMLKVDDLKGMGTTAPATIRHWVGYAAVGFR